MIFMFLFFYYIQGFGNGGIYWCIVLGKQDGWEKISGVGKGLFYMYWVECYNIKFYFF